MLAAYPSGTINKFQIPLSCKAALCGFNIVAFGPLISCSVSPRSIVPWSNVECYHSSFSPKGQIQHRWKWMRFIWKACQFPPSLVITRAVVIKSLLRIKMKAIHDGCYEEACIVMFLVLDIIVRVSNEYSQSRQFAKLIEVIRGGESVWVSIYDIVVGDIVPLKKGGRVYADGVAYSLKIDEHMK